MFYLNHAPERPLGHSVVAHKMVVDDLTQCLPLVKKNRLTCNHELKIKT